ncbi:hypothetical protein HK097_009844 [Rhizophlyctis rosea]|uniref:Uncharacterized protein n=1 Tax=Rhizophlyctis rosea TaxID=64517 RepID=A0AAD5SKL2_9FUNG|nr:hypothetical protein HK097_009844 [Rhizophlyctis rosea]
MKYPQWLQYAQLENEADETSVAHIQLVDPPFTMETFPALQLAFDCAKTVLLGDTGFSALADSFDEPIEKADVHAALDETKLHVTKWLRAARDAFHLPAHNKPESIMVGNVFVNFDDVHYFLPKGAAALWSIAEQSRIVLVAWFLIHDLSHAVGSVLAYQKKIVAPGTPKKATAFAENGNINVKYVAWDEHGNMTGERGWWMEDKLGGKVSLYEKENQLIIARPDEGKYYPFTADMIRDFLSNGTREYGTYQRQATRGKPLTNSNNRWMKKHIGIYFLFNAVVKGQAIMRLLRPILRVGSLLSLK